MAVCAFPASSLSLLTTKETLATTLDFSRAHYHYSTAHPLSQQRFTESAPGSSASYEFMSVIENLKSFGKGPSSL